MLTGERLIMLASAAVAVLLQVIIAPHIVIGYAYPNIIAACCLAITLVQPGLFRHGLAFAMGLAFDLVSGGPVGAMAFSLTVGAALSSWLFSRSNNDTAFMGIATAAAGLLLVEVLYGVFLLVFGFSANLIEAFFFRILPCFVYDVVFAAALYPLAMRFLAGSAPIRSEIKQLH